MSFALEDESCARTFSSSSSPPRAYPYGSESCYLPPRTIPRVTRASVVILERAAARSPSTCAPLSSPSLARCRLAPRTNRARARATTSSFASLDSRASIASHAPSRFRRASSASIAFLKPFLRSLALLPGRKLIAPRSRVPSTGNARRGASRASARASTSATTCAVFGAGRPLIGRLVCAGTHKNHESQYYDIGNTNKGSRRPDSRHGSRLIGRESSRPRRRPHTRARSIGARSPIGRHGERHARAHAHGER